MEALLLILVLLASGATIAVLLLVLGALFPNTVADVRRTADAMPGRSFGVGVVNFLFLGALIAAFGALSDGGGGQLAGLLAGIFLVVLTVLVAFGLAGVASLVGRRLFPERHPRGADARGAGLLAFACLAPFVGWFGLLPFVGLLGLGAFLLGRLLSWRAAAPGTTTVAPAPASPPEPYARSPRAQATSRRPSPPGNPNSSAWHLYLPSAEVAR